MGQDIKDKKRDKRVRDGDPTWRGRSFQTAGNPLPGRSVGSFGVSEGNITQGRGGNTQSRCLTATVNRGAAQMLASATSERRLGREAWVASSALGVRARPECPEDNLRKLM